MGVKTSFQNLCESLKILLSHKVDKVSGKGLSTNDYTTTEKNKLAGIAEGANKYSLPTASSSTLGGIKVGTNLSISSGVLSATNTTYSAATTSTAGLMSASDKTKLDGVATGANKYVLPTATSTTLGGVKVDTALSTASSNPVQNKAVTAKINNIVTDTTSEIAAIVNNYGSKNLANAALIPDQTAGGITRKNNGDGSITYSGTSTLTYTTYLPLMAGQKLDAGTYIFTSNPTTNTTYTYQIYKNGSYWQAYTIGAKLQITESDTYSIGLALNSKASISNTFKPMLRYASIKDDTFVPYVPTNKQLDGRTSDTGWKTTSNLKYRKSGYIVGLQGAVTPTASTMSIILGTLPEGCRPLQDIYIAQSHTDTPSRRLIIDTKGVVTMLFASNCTASHSYAYNGTFML